MGASLNSAAGTRMCVFCGKPMPARLNRCPTCREEVPQVRMSPRVMPRSVPGRGQMRRGFLYMLLAGVIQFFAAGYSGMSLPVAVPPMVTVYLAPMVFMAGLGLLIYGIILRMKS
jgi:hypothetical protein